MNLRLHRLLLDPQGGEGNGNSTTQDGAKGASATSNGQGPDLVKAIEGLITKHGGQDNALRVLLNENHDYRNQIRDLKKSLPAEGSRVLTGDQAALWDSYTTLGTVDDLKATLAERDSYKAKATGYERKEEIRGIAALHGYDPDVLADRAGDLAFEMKDVVEGGKTTKRAHVKDGDKLVPLDDYAKANWAKYLPVLKAGQGAAIPGTPGRRTPTPAPVPSSPPTAPARRMTL